MPQFLPPHPSFSWSLLQEQIQLLYTLMAVLNGSMMILNSTHYNVTHSFQLGELMGKPHCCLGDSAKIKCTLRYTGRKKCNIQKRTLSLNCVKMWVWLHSPTKACYGPIINHNKTANIIVYFIFKYIFFFTLKDKFTNT